MLVGCVQVMYQGKAVSLVAMLLQRCLQLVQKQLDFIGTWPNDGMSIAGFVEMTCGTIIKEGCFDWLRCMMLFESLLMFLNVFVE